MEHIRKYAALMSLWAKKLPDLWCRAKHLLDTSSRLALLRNSSYIKLSVRFTVQSSQFIVKSYELRLRVHSQ